MVLTNFELFAVILIADQNDIRMDFIILNTCNKSWCEDTTQYGICHYQNGCRDDTIKLIGWVVKRVAISKFFCNYLDSAEN